jgi:hypothetical protein
MLHRQPIRKLIQQSALRNRSGLLKRSVAIGVSMFMAWSVPMAVAQHKYCDACQGRSATHVQGAAHCNHCDGGSVSIPSLQTLIIDKLSAAGDRIERNHAARNQLAKAHTHRSAKPVCASNASVIPSSLRFTKAKEPSCGVEVLGVSPKHEACDAKAFWGRAGDGTAGSLNDRQFSDRPFSDRQSRVTPETSVAGSKEGSKTDSAKPVATQQSPVATQQSNDGRLSVPPDVAATLEHNSDSSESTNGSVAPKLIPPPATKSSVPTSTKGDGESSESDAPPAPPEVPQTLEAISKSLDGSKGIEARSPQLPSGGLIPPATIEPPNVLEKSPPLLDSVPPAPMPKPKSLSEPSETEPLPDILVDPFIEDARSSKPKRPGSVELSSGKGQLKPLTLGSPSQNPINKLRRAEGGVISSLRSSEIGDEALSRSMAPRRLSQSQKDAGHKESAERQAEAEGAIPQPAPNTFVPRNGLRSN